MDLVRARLRRLSESLRSLPERLGRSAAVPAPDRRTHSVRQGDGRPPASQHGDDYSQAGSSSDSGDTVRQYITIDEVMATPQLDGRADRGRSPDTREAGGLAVRYGVRSEVDYPLFPPPPQWSTPSHRQRVHPPPSVPTAAPRYVSQRHTSPRRGQPRHVSPPRVSRRHASPHVLAQHGPAVPVPVIDPRPPLHRPRYPSNSSDDDEEVYGCHGSTGHRPRIGMHRGPPRNIRPPTRRQPLNLDKFDGTSRDWTDYQEHFDQVAGWNQWSESEAAMQLAAALRPPASAVMQDLRPYQKQHVQSIMQVLSSRFAPQGRQIAYRTDYYNRVQIKGESVDDFGRALKDLHRRAFPSKGLEGDDSELIERYAQGLWDEDVQRDVRRAKCSTLEACITVAIESQSIAKAIRGRRSRLAAAVVPGDAGATPAAPPSRQTVNPPNGAREAGITPADLKKLITDTFRAEMAKLETGGRTGRADVVCFYCQRRGHYQSDCRQRQAGRPPAGREGRAPPQGPSRERQSAPLPPATPPLN